MMKRPFAQDFVFALVAFTFVVSALIIAGCQPGLRNKATGVTPTATVTYSEPLPTVTATSTALSPTVASGGRTSVPTPSPMATVIATPSPMPTPTCNNPELTGFMIPIRGSPLPSDEGQMPGAPRAYRGGVHEGIDFYYTDAKGSPVTYNTEVLAAKAGKVIRADLDYVEVTQAEMDRMLSESQRLGNTPPAILDRLRGRQVWIDHGDGVVSRYAHLDRIAPSIQTGTEVRKGQLLGYVGNSGTPEAAKGLKLDVHLHLEIWVNERFLGEGLTMAEIRTLLAKVFSD